MISQYFIFVLVAAALSFILTPLVRSFAERAQILDFPSERKIHKKPVPLLGGVPIFISFNLAITLGAVFHSGYIKELIFSRWQELLICQIFIVVLGIVDDIRYLKPTVKLAFQIFIGVLVVLFGFGITTISNPFAGGVIHLGIFSIPLTILWVVGIINALNLVDGLDGLAAGTSVIVCLTIFGISSLTKNADIAFISVCLGGSIIGFLRYNFHPAKIFLGNSGSYLLGFLLAFISIQGSTKGAALVAVSTPILVLGFPIMDTLLSIFRRFLRAVHVVDYPTKNGRFRALFFGRFAIFEADADHMHHRLMKIGFSQKKAVIILYGICLALSSLAFLSVAISNINAFALLGAILIAIIIGIRNLRYQEFKILENGLLIPLFNFPVIDKSYFQAFLDLVMLSFSFYLSVILVFGNSNQSQGLFLQFLPLVLLIKIVVFYLSSLYRRSWIYSGLEDALVILKAVLLSSISVVTVFSLFFNLKLFGGVIFFVLDFYISLSLVAGFRVSYRIFNTFYRQSSTNNGRKVLIYGAGYRGSTVLREIRNNDAYSLTPAGFIDDDSEKIGKSMHGIPILGKVEDLDKILEGKEISEIIVSSAKIGKDKIKRLIELCRNKGIVIRQFEFRFYEFS